MSLDFNQNFFVRDTKREFGELSEFTGLGELAGECGQGCPRSSVLLQPAGFCFHLTCGTLRIPLDGGDRLRQGLV